MNNDKKTPYQFIRSTLREQREARRRARRIQSKGTRKTNLAPLVASAVYLMGQTPFAQLLFQHSADFLIMKLEDLRRVESATGKQVDQMNQTELLDTLEEMNIRTARMAKNSFGEVLPFLLINDPESPSPDDPAE